MDQITGGFFVIGLWLCGAVLVIAWIVMPFAIIGTKSILRELLAEMKEHNRLLRAQQSADAARPR